MSLGLLVEDMVEHEREDLETLRARSPCEKVCNGVGLLSVEESQV